VVYLAEELVHNLVFKPANAASESPCAEALFLWLVHLLTSPEWETLRPFCPRNYILTACNENPNHWAKMLSARLRKEEPLKDAQPRVPPVTQKRSKKGTSQSGTVNLSNVDQKLQEHGWGPVGTWDSRPLGIASS